MIHKNINESPLPYPEQPIKNILIRHLGNMGDMVFFIPPVLETLKKHHPQAKITFVTAWGFKEASYNLSRQSHQFLPRLRKTETWGRRNQGGFSIHLMVTNPHIDHLVHFHPTTLDSSGNTCQEQDIKIPTWSHTYYEQQKQSGRYDAVYELDFGIDPQEDPILAMYRALGLPKEDYSHYRIYLTEQDRAVAQATIEHYPHPRIVLLEGLEGTTTRGWDPGKIPILNKAIKKVYNVDPIVFGSKHIPAYQGRPLTLRENIARLTFCDVGIGVLSGPLHFAAAVGLPTITLYGDQPIHRAAPAYFLNKYAPAAQKLHKTIVGPSSSEMRFLKEGTTALNLTPQEWQSQHYQDWQHPGRQSTKSCLAVITVDEVMTVLKTYL